MSSAAAGSVVANDDVGLLVPNGVPANAFAGVSAGFDGAAGECAESSEARAPIVAVATSRTGGIGRFGTKGNVDAGARVVADIAGSVREISSNASLFSGAGVGFAGAGTGGSTTAGGETGAAGDAGSTAAIGGTALRFAPEGDGISVGPGSVVFATSTESAEDAGNRADGAGVAEIAISESGAFVAGPVICPA
jgi:hypothetical protein